jgi:putative peptide zinc metalloprotease protein
MPTNRALLTADRGRVVALIDGHDVTLEQGDRRYVGANTRIEVADKSTGRLTFQGGSAALLCAGSRTEVGPLFTDTGRHRDPHAAVTMDSGRMLADTTSTSGAYRPLTLAVNRTLGNVTNSGVAWFAVDPSTVTVSTGRVSVAGTLSTPTRADLTCGDGVPVEPPAAGPSESPSEEPPSDLPSEVPSPTPSPSPTTAPPVIPEPNQPQQPNPPNPTTARTTPPPRTTRPRTTPPKTTPPVRTTPPSTPPTSASPSQSSSSPPIG